LSDPANQRTEKCPALKINELRIVRPCKFHELRNVRTEKCPATILNDWQYHNEYVIIFGIGKQFNQLFTMKIMLLISC